jgi:hypothetical protein
MPPEEKAIMKLKSLLATIVAVGLIGCAASPAAKNPSLDEVIQQAAERIEERLDNGTKVALVNVQSPTAQFSEYVLAYLESILVNNGKLIVVDRSNLDKIRQELGFQLSGEVSDESAKTIGKMIGAGAIVTGSLLALGDTYRLTLKAINVETATVAASYPADIAQNERVRALLNSGNTQVAGTPGITIVNNTGSVIVRVGLFPFDLEDVSGRLLLDLDGNMDNKTSKRFSLPQTVDSTKKYDIVLAAAEGGGYIKNNMTIKPGMSVTFTQSDKVPPTAAATPAVPAASGYKIGDTGPAGGIIFYVKSNNIGGWRYLEAAPANTEKTAPSSYDRNFDRSRKVGDGKENTKKFMEVFEREGGGINTAAWLCNDLNINGFNDWYLPSLDELLYMYNNLYSKGLGGFKNAKYWASSGYGAYYINFSDGSQDFTFGNSKYQVRAVRQF